MTEETLTSGDAAVGADTPADSDNEAVEDEATLQAEGTEGEETKTESTEDDEYEDFEHEGEKYKVPKALKLKDGYLRQADYTRKTQEVAEQRRAVEAERESFKQSQAAQKTYVADVGRLHVIDDQIAYYQKVDWPTLAQSNPDQYQQHRAIYETLKDQRELTSKKVTEHETKAKSEGDSERSKRIQGTVETLVREIPGWNDELAGKTIKFAAEKYGLTEAEALALAETPFAAKLIKMVHGAMTVAEAAQKARTAIEKAKPNADAKPALPIKQVSKQRSGPPPSAGPSDGDDIDTWVKKRNAQEAKQNAAYRR